MLLTTIISKIVIENAPMSVCTNLWVLTGSERQSTRPEGLLTVQSTQLAMSVRHQEAVCRGTVRIQQMWPVQFVMR